MSDLYRGEEIDALPKERGAVSIVGSWLCADALWKVGKPATTWGFGWQDDWTFYMTGRHVVLAPERNDVAWPIARGACKSLYGYAASIRWIVMPVEDDGGVLSWFSNGGNVQTLSRLVGATTPVTVGLEWNDKEFERVWAAQERHRTVRGW